MEGIESVHVVSTDLVNERAAVPAPTQVVMQLF
jgi:hypothetical protein